MKTIRARRTFACLKKPNIRDFRPKKVIVLKPKEDFIVNYLFDRETTLSIFIVKEFDGMQEFSRSTS